MTAHPVAVGTIDIGTHITWTIGGLTFNVDTILGTLIAGAILIGLGFWIRRGVTSGVRKRGQLLFETVTDTVEKQVESTLGIKTAPFVVPLATTLFFFILFANLLGLIPYGSTATGNISVTATLAIITFFVVEIAGMRALGKKYLGTIFYWPHDMSIGMKLPMTLVMTPIEFISKLTKPFALAIRLFANMVAGHIVVLALIGLIFTFGSYVIAPLPLLMAFAIMILEIFVALLQAYIFALLASVFIGLIRESAH